MKIAIVGSRGYKDINKVIEYVNALPLDTIVVSGGAIGVDQMAALTATGRGLQLKIFYPNWTKHGKAAGMIRNGQIVAECDKLVAFWDGTSKGTLDSINKAKAAGKPVEVIK